MDEKLRLLSPDATELTSDEQLAIRSPKDCLLDIGKVSLRLQELTESIESIKLWTDSEIKIKGIDELERILGNKLRRQKR